MLWCAALCYAMHFRYMNAYPNIVGVSKNGIVRYQDLLEVLPTCSISEGVRAHILGAVAAPQLRVNVPTIRPAVLFQPGYSADLLLSCVVSSLCPHSSAVAAFVRG